MIFSIGFIKAKNKVLIKTFDLVGQTNLKTITIDEIKNEKVNLMILDVLENENEIMSLLEEENKYYPICNASTLKLNEESFNQLSFQLARDIIKQAYANWVLNCNLKSLENLFVTLDHLKELMPNDRVDFFEELWFIIKRNLGAITLKLIFNNIKPNEKGQAKSQLTQFRIDGVRLPSTHVGDEFEKSLMETYRPQMDHLFNITEYNKSQGQIVICALIKESPVIIMAELFDFTSLQKSLLTALFEGLQRI
ncbi:MAG: hypothetical protein A2381_13075 [Bdellovibrionales bacterium RIFOXYB1_FULL_37_110]|nr:MAG: hypothetical protein A2181_02400 [Bdellovibrionales bacterium RIFOXYA1_FULL_38_20]OFZ51639.1 MAG: hypothetical protein A2417_12735 [Bdellovibrionales bacterium RIFOXYC1_FULL_37_79]OFZ60466.1 MAG: hypothetical protein A2381_13075 [Bdellovibrionales bacterium RIFOXYB1_FULL_37_110]OFZ65039.1 MAG: hypothetical protein A2577_09340 [Bdellovibrionales bacterium RIFOXYD1_FULL_36_51]